MGGGKRRKADVAASGPAGEARYRVIIVRDAICSFSDKGHDALMEGLSFALFGADCAKGIECGHDCGDASGLSRGRSGGNPQGHEATARCVLEIACLLVPRELEVTHSGGVKGMSDAELEAGIEMIRSMLAAREAGAGAKVIEALPEPRPPETSESLPAAAGDARRHGHGPPPRP